MPRVKICGVTNAADRDAVVAAGADAVGFIVDVSVDTSREIEPDAAAQLVDGVPPFVTSVLVTMPSDVRSAVELQRHVGADAVQIHGTLPARDLATLRERIDAGLIAVADSATDDVGALARVADALLVDTTDPDGGGGTGETHDWSRTRQVIAPLSVPVILAGGLTPHNVASAVTTVEPFAVDTASGVEQSSGKKDHEAVRRFVRNATHPEAGA